MRLHNGHETRARGLSPMLAGISILLALGQLAPAAQTPSEDPLWTGFQTPPDQAKPRVWWHWMNGNVTQEGIRRDLEWMKRIGVGGADAIDASIGTPQVVKTRLVYMSP